MKIRWSKHMLAATFCMMVQTVLARKGQHISLWTAQCGQFDNATHRVQSMLLASNNCCVRFACKASTLWSSHQSQLYTKFHLPKTSTCQIKQLALQIRLGHDKAPGFTNTSPSERVCTGCCIHAQSLPWTLSSTPCTSCQGLTELFGLSWRSDCCLHSLHSRCSEEKALTLSHDYC